MKTLLKSAAFLGLLLSLSACLPVAMLETATPVQGQQFTVGLTGVVAVSQDAPVGALPYLAYRWGDGETEFSVSTQIGLRGGIKQRVTDYVSVAGGLTVPWAVFTSAGGPAVPFTADAAVLVQATPELTVAGRGLYAYVGDWGGTWLGGANLVYQQDLWLFEGGFLFSTDGNPIVSVSAGYRL
jgi:hypothetical protein